MRHCTFDDVAKLLTGADSLDDVDAVTVYGVSEDLELAFAALSRRAPHLSALSIVDDARSIARFPRGLENLTRLASVRLELGTWSDLALNQLFSALARLPELRELDLSANEFDTVPDAIGILRGLERLDVSRNVLLTTVSPKIAALPRLRSLSVKKCDCFIDLVDLKLRLPGVEVVT